MRRPAPTNRALGAWSLGCIVLLGSFGWLSAIVPVGAHTAPVPVELSPVPGEELESVPESIYLRFDGDLTPDSAVALLDAEGATVPSEVVQDDKEFTIRPDRPVEMPDGTYRIAWDVQTTHSVDSPDGEGAESRQSHFFVGATTSGTPMSGEPLDLPQAGGSDDGPPSWLALVAGAVAAGAIVVAVRSRSVRSLALSVAFLSASAAAFVALTGSDGDAGPDDRVAGAPTWSATADDGTEVKLTTGDDWELRLLDEQGRATPWASAAQLRAVGEDGETEIIDMTVDIGEVGRLVASPGPQTDDGDVELVVTTFSGPVVSFELAD